MRLAYSGAATVPDGTWRTIIPSSDEALAGSENLLALKMKPCFGSGQCK
jgi:hypothetical protein